MPSISDSTPADLTFAIDPGESTWTVVGPTPESAPHVVPSPLEDLAFLGNLSGLRAYGNWSVPVGEARSKAIERSLADLARQISERITPLLLSAEARSALIRRLNQVDRGRARLTIQVADRGPLGDQVLALPWELIAPEPGFFPVRQSVLEVVRESVAEEAPDLPEPAGPLAVAVAVFAASETPHRGGPVPDRRLAGSETRSFPIGRKAETAGPVPPAGSVPWATQLPHRHRGALPGASSEVG